LVYPSGNIESAELYVSSGNLFGWVISGPIQNLLFLNEAVGDESLYSYWNTKTHSPALGNVIKYFGNNGTQSIKFLSLSVSSTPVILTFILPDLVVSTTEITSPTRIIGITLVLVLSV
jgi:hypothetical protein